MDHSVQIYRLKSEKRFFKRFLLSGNLLPSRVLLVCSMAISTASCGENDSSKSGTADYTHHHQSEGNARHCHFWSRWAVMVNRAGEKVYLCRLFN